MPGHKGRRGTGGVIAAIIIVLLLLLAVGLYYWEEGYRRKLDQLSALRQERLALQAQASMLVHVGALGNATGENISILVYNGAGFPLSLAALTLVTTTGQVDVINSTHTPAFVAEARAYLYRQGPTGLVLVASYPDLQQAIARGLVIPQTFLLEINITATQPLDALHTHLGFKAPLTSGSTQALVPIVLQATTTYTSPQQAITGGGGGAPAATTTATTTSTTTTTTPPGCYIPVTITNPTNIDLQDYPVKITLNSTNLNATIWSQLNESKIYAVLPNGTPLYYYIEYFNSTEERAVIWVNASIPAGSSVTVYLYYNYTGTNPYASYNDPYKVFPYFNPGDTLNFYTYPYFTPVYNWLYNTYYWVYGGTNESAWQPNSTYHYIENYVEQSQYQVVDMFALLDMSEYPSLQYSMCISSYINLNNNTNYYNSVGIGFVSGDYTVRRRGTYYGNYSEIYLFWDTYTQQAYLEFYQVINGEDNFVNETYLNSIINPASWYRLSVCIDINADKILFKLSTISYSEYIVVNVTDNSKLPYPLGPLSYVGLEGGFEYGATHLYRNIIIRPFVYSGPEVIVSKPVCTG